MTMYRAKDIFSKFCYYYRGLMQLNLSVKMFRMFQNMNNLTSHLQLVLVVVGVYLVNSVQAVSCLNGVRLNINKVSN